jgi:hypothetical protein
MSSPKPVYLVSAWKGRVVTEHPSSEPSGVVMEHAGFKDAEQKWIAEFGEEPDTVTLLSVSNKKYMTPTSKKYAHMAGTGEKIWWKISYDDVRIPGAFRLSVAGGRDDLVLAYVNMEGTSSMVKLDDWEVCFVIPLAWMPGVCAEAPFAEKLHRTQNDMVVCGPRWLSHVRQIDACCS